jgi:hypothetical protein
MSPRKLLELECNTPGFPDRAGAGRGRHIAPPKFEPEGVVRGRLDIEPLSAIEAERLEDAVCGDIREPLKRRISTVFSVASFFATMRTCLPSAVYQDVV